MVVSVRLLADRRSNVARLPVGVTSPIGQTENGRVAFCASMIAVFGQRKTQKLVNIKRI